VRQDVIGYSQVPVNAEHCSLCTQFIPSKTCHKESCFGSCRQVHGEINPNGWCKIFVKQTARRKAIYRELHLAIGRDDRHALPKLS